MLLGGLVLSCSSRRRRHQKTRIKGGNPIRRQSKRYYPWDEEPGDIDDNGERRGLICWSGSFNAVASSWRHGLVGKAASEQSFLSRFSKESASTTSRTDEDSHRDQAAKTDGRPSQDAPLPKSADSPSSVHDAPSIEQSPSFPNLLPGLCPVVAQDVLFPINSIEFPAKRHRTRGRSDTGDLASVADSKVAPSVVSHLGMEDPINALKRPRLWAIPSNGADAPCAIDFDFDPRRTNLRLLCLEPEPPLRQDSPGSASMPSKRALKGRKSIAWEPPPSGSTPAPKSRAARGPIELDLPPASDWRPPSPPKPRNLHPKPPHPAARRAPAPKKSAQPRPRTLRIRVQLQGGSSSSDHFLEDSQKLRAVNALVTELVHACRERGMAVELVLKPNLGPLFTSSLGSPSEDDNGPAIRSKESTIESQPEVVHQKDALSRPSALFTD